MDRAGSGKIIDGKYELLSVLGQGGLGTVYKAWQKDLNRFVAIKFLNINTTVSSDSAIRFEREARILANLQHKNIVAIFNFGRTDDDINYMTMEYLEGITLAKMSAEQELDIKRILKIFIQITDAVAYAHEHGIVHRDLKPQNIMLIDSPEKDSVKILDFGLSRLIEGSFDPEQKLTQTGALIGSVHYMAPELCMGQKADIRADIYSIACMLYECLAHKVPFDAEHPLGILHKQVNEQAAPLPENLPKELRFVVSKCLQKDRGRRYQQAAELSNALTLIMTDRSEDLNLEEKLLPDERGKNTGKILIASLLLLISVMGSGLFIQDKYVKRRQEEIQSVPKNRTTDPEYRKMLQDKANKLGSDALKQLRADNKSMALLYANRAFLTICQPFSGAARNREFAVKDTEILNKILPALRTTAPSAQEKIISAENVLKGNDEGCLLDRESADFYLAVSDLRAAIKSPISSYENFYSCLRRLAEIKQFELSETLLAEREKMKITDEDDKLGKPMIMQMARTLLAKTQNKKCLQTELAKAEKQLARYADIDLLLTIDYYLELADMCKDSGDRQMAERLLEKAEKISMLVQDPHPDRYCNVQNKRFSIHFHFKEYDKAEADLQRLEIYTQSSSELCKETFWQKQLAENRSSLEEFKKRSK